MYGGFSKVSTYTSQMTLGVSATMLPVWIVHNIMERGKHTFVGLFIRQAM